ncbi:hypothetical protein [Rivularia sp. UHCC 0363]|uniref:hypothetical protein n=1 Tax=Rivularia sp. UHCC 0363 TaxID=3110244 RepID=UPI002B213168|nr:hypothetical protein [Rivularia sp. UHCC 0363]MEA5595820.1 hypothetical protein [Rivularia sp. UHCC 0363]
MDNNESKSYNREVRQDSFTDADGNIHTNVTRTSETVENDPNTYEEGYVSGRIQERNYQRRDLAARDTNNANSGLILGILLATFATLAGGAMWYFNQYREADKTTPTVIETPVTTEPTLTEPEAAQPPQNNTTTIIEKTKEVAVPVEVPVAVPQQQAPAPAPAPQQPDININVPPQQGASGSNSTPQKTTPKQPQSSNGGSNNSSQQPQSESNSNNSTSTVSPPNVLGTDTPQ